MVNLNQTGQTGSMTLSEDGSIISSSGDLSSSEQTAHTIMNLLTHSLQVDFNGSQTANGGQNGYTNQAVVNDNERDGGVVKKWNRITVTFDKTVYIGALTNKRITITKKDSNHDPAEEESHNANDQK